eukprot:g4169.t1
MTALPVYVVAEILLLLLAATGSCNAAKVDKAWQGVDNNPEVQFRMGFALCNARELGILVPLRDTVAAVLVRSKHELKHKHISTEQADENVTGTDHTSDAPEAEFVVEAPEDDDDRDLSPESRIFLQDFVDRRISLRDPVSGEERWDVPAISLLLENIDYLIAEDEGVAKVLYYALETCPGTLFELLNLYFAVHQHEDSYMSRQLGLVARFFRKKLKYFANIFKMTTHERTERRVFGGLAEAGPWAEKFRAFLGTAAAGGGGGEEETASHEAEDVLVGTTKIIANKTAETLAQHKLTFLRQEVACAPELFEKVIEANREADRTFYAEQHGLAVVDAALLGIEHVEDDAALLDNIKGRSFDNHVSTLATLLPFDLDHIPTRWIEKSIPALLHPACVCREVRKPACLADVGDADSCDQLGDILGVEPLCYLSHLVLHFKEQMKREDELWMEDSSKPGRNPLLISAADRRLLFFGQLTLLWHDDVEERRIEKITAAQQKEVVSQHRAAVEEDTTLVAFCLSVGRADQMRLHVPADAMRHVRLGWGPRFEDRIVFVVNEPVATRAEDNVVRIAQDADMTGGSTMFSSTAWSQIWEAVKTPYALLLDASAFPSRQGFWLKPAAAFLDRKSTLGANADHERETSVTRIVSVADKILSPRRRDAVDQTAVQSDAAAAFGEDSVASPEEGADQTTEGSVRHATQSAAIGFAVRFAEHFYLLGGGGGGKTSLDDALLASIARKKLFETAMGVSGTNIVVEVFAGLDLELREVENGPDATTTLPVLRFERERTDPWFSGRFNTDILGGRDAWLVRKPYEDRESQHSDELVELALAEGFVRFQRGPLSAALVYEPGLSEILYPAQMVEVSQPDTATERFLQDERSHEKLENLLSYDGSYRGASEPPDETPAIAETHEEVPRPQVVFEGLEFLFHTRELFGNNLMDRMELLHLVSSQPSNTFVLLPEISDYKNTVANFHVEKFDDERKKYIDEKKQLLGEENFGLIFEEHLPTDGSKYWGFGGANDYRVWSVRRWDDFFDAGKLDSYLKSRGSGGLLVRNEDGTLRKFNEAEGEDTRTTTRTKTQEQPPSKSSDSVRHMDVLLLGEAVAVEPSRFVIMGHSSKRVAIIPCEDSLHPVTIQFFKSTYHFARGTRCVRNEGNPAWLNFPKLQAVIAEETQFAYDAELKERKRRKMWADVLKTTQHWERDVVPFMDNEFLNVNEKHEEVEARYGRKMPALMDTLKFEELLPDHRRGENSFGAQPVLKIGFYMQLGEGLEGDKMNLGKYQNWGPNTISATSLWSGVAFSERIENLGSRIRALVDDERRRNDGESRWTTTKFQKGVFPSRPLWVVHWRRGDGAVCPTEVRVQQYRQALPENLGRLVKKSVLTEYFKEHLTYDFYGRGGGAERTIGIPPNNSASAAEKVEMGFSSVVVEGTSLTSTPTFAATAPDFFIMTNEMDAEVLDSVREGFRTQLPHSSVFFLSDFLVQGEKKTRENEDEAKANDPSLAADLGAYLKNGGVFALLLEFHIACHADVFLGYMTGLFEGGASVPTMLVNQLRLHQCGTRPSLGLFGPLKENVKRPRMLSLLVLLLQQERSVAERQVKSRKPLAAAQRQRRPDEALPPGLERWIGRDECDEKNGWVQFYHTFSSAIQQAQSANVISQPMLTELQNGTLPERNEAVIKQDGSAIGILRELTDNFLKLPEKAFQCGTAMSSVFSMLSTLYDSVNLPMKGEDYIDQSPWPITWKESIELSLKRMDRVQKLQRAENWRRQKLPKRPSAPKLKILIVSVCEYNNDVTPLYSLSLWNKKRYADKHGYAVTVHAKGPLLQDQFAGLYEEPPAHRPPAWSKIDAVLLGLREGHDWVMWMDCDSYFMDQDLGINELIDYVLEKEANDAAAASPPGGERRAFSDPPLQEFLKEWDKAPGTMESFDKMLASSSSLDDTKIGWDDWLLHATYEKNGQKRTELIVSEDGLMLNTGIFFVRSSVWAWRFFQKVRRFTFGPRAPITQHPWWEQTAMVYLIQMPFANEKHWAVAPAVSLLDQKHINPYPHLVSSALLTHVAFDDSDYIISFSGCKIYSSQDVCNALFFNYFAKSVPDYANIDDDVLQAWVKKGSEKYR